MNGNREYKAIYRRAGISALYALTPFKILESSDEYYELILPDIEYFEKYPKDVHKWFIGFKRAKDVVVPIRLFSFRFRRNSTTRIIYIRRGRKQKSYSGPEEHIADLDAEVIKFSPKPIYMEFSFGSLTKPKICRKGIVLISSESKCPLEKVCPERKGSPCEHYIAVNNTYLGIFNVYPSISMYVEFDESLLEDVAVLPFDGKPLIELYYVPRVNVYAYIDNIVFTPKAGWRYEISRFRFFLKPKIGVEVQSTQGILLVLNNNVFDEIVEKVFRSESQELAELKKWLTFKYVYGRVKPRDEARNKGRRFAKIVDGFNGFTILEDDLYRQLWTKEMNLVEDEVRKYLRKILEEPSMFKDFTAYMSYVFIHSLAHAFLSSIEVAYNIPEDELAYTVVHQSLPNAIKLPMGTYTYALIFEDAIGGFGYLKTLKNDIILREEVLRELVGYTLRILKSCSNRESLYVREFLRYLNIVKNKLPESRYKTALDRLRALIDFGIYPHILSLRRAIISKLEEDSVDENIRRYIEELLASMPLCWDGCPHCLIFERGCNMSPYDQPFTLSRKLLEYILNRIIQSLSGKVEFLAKNVAFNIRWLLETVRREIRIATASLSPELLTQIAASKPSIGIRVIALDDFLSEEDRRKIREIIHTYPNVKVRVRSDIHAKGIAIDRKILIHGSFNFTIQGLTTNLENIKISYSPSEINQFIERFDRYWIESKDVV